MRDIDSGQLTALCPDPIIGVNRSGIIQVFNPAAEKLLGYRAAEVVDRMAITEIYGGEARAREIKRLLHSDRFGPAGQLEGFETFLTDAMGNQIPIRLSASLIARGEEEVGSIGFFHDMTERKRLEHKLQHLSITDELTGLYNQRHFYKVLAAELERVQRYQTSVSLICFDLDNFKSVNDSMGHLEGDRILRQVGEMLASELRTVDIAFRYGGDEFMVVLPETCLREAVVFAERLRLAFNDRCDYTPLRDAPEGSAVSMSLGVTDSGGEENLDHLVQRADLAMYQAKQSGGNRTVMINRIVGRNVESALG